MTDEPSATYRDGMAAVGDRIADLLGRMTVAEKIGQSVGAAPYVTMREGDLLDAVEDGRVGAVSPSPLYSTRSP
jgi:hypothetical protein